MKNLLTISIIVFIILAVLSPGAWAAPEILSESAVLMDASTGQVLWSKNPDLQAYPASITKILTAYLASEYLTPEETMTMSYYAVFSIPRGSSHIALNEGEEIKVKDALAALMTASANDCANGLAEHISGSIELFSELMNEKAVELGANNSNFVNPSGLSDENHYTTAYDMAVITKAAFENPLFREYFNISSYEMPPTNLQPESRLFNNQHNLLYLPKSGRYDHEGITILGGKLGWTSQATNTMVTVGEKDGRTLIAVVMKCASATEKYQDTIAMLNYGFAEFKSVNISAAEINKFLKNTGYGELKTPQNYTVWTDEWLDTNKITLAFNNSVNGAKIDFTMDNAGDIQHLGSLFLTSEPIPVSQSAVNVASLEDDSQGFRFNWIMLIIAVFIISGIAVLVLDARQRRRYKARRRQIQGRRLFP